MLNFQHAGNRFIAQSWFFIGRCRQAIMLGISVRQDFNSFAGRHCRVAMHIQNRKKVPV